MGLHFSAQRRHTLYLISVLCFSLSLAFAQDFSGRFDTAWRLVNERYWDLSRLSVNWNEVRERYEPKALEAQDEAGFYEVLEQMFAEIGDNHSVFVPPDKVLEIRASYGDLPCLGVFGQTSAVQLGHISYELLEDHIAYIKLPDLASDFVASHVREAVVTLEREAARAYILDMRGNPGGRLVSMMQVAGIFTSGFLWRTLTNWTLPLPYPSLGALETEKPLVVLIDGDVNSAAEGLAGALQKKGRATIIGETSAGNVEAILPFCLRDGSQAWIATGVLAPIGGPTWEGVGVIPDIKVASADALNEALRFLKGSQ
jgi:carboxyl-terminal processing protease